MPRTLTIELPLFHHWHCNSCGHIQMSEYPMRSSPGKCTECGADASGYWRNPPRNYPYFYHDEEPRSYNLIDSRDKEVQVYFSVPGWAGRRGFTCGIKDPEELEGLSIQEALSLVKEKILRYLMHSDKQTIQELEKFVRDAPEETKAEWARNERIYNRERAALALLDSLDDLLPEDQT